MPQDLPSAEERIGLINEVAEKLYQATDSWHLLSCSIAYLFWAIAAGNHVDLKGSTFLPEGDDDYLPLDAGEEPNPDDVLLTLLKKHFPAEHPVWRYVLTG